MTKPSLTALSPWIQNLENCAVRSIHGYGAVIKDVRDQWDTDPLRMMRRKAHTNDENNLVHFGAPDWPKNHG